ncbi:MAG: hypothetical protein K2G30_07845 [Muribaculaceae bacterium]|nr:hypothetical protein [Muribaculaceae bacterium]
MKIFKTFAAAMLLLAGATACDNSNEFDIDPEVYLVLNPNVSFTTSKDLAAGEWGIFDAPTYDFKINTSTFNASLNVTKLTYAEGKTISFTLDNLLLTVDPKDNAWTLTNRNPLSIRDTDGGEHEITGFNAYIFSSGRAPEIVRVEYTLDNAYKIRGVMKYNAFTGKTTVTAASAAIEPYENESTVYFLILDHKNKKAKILLYDTKFAANMPRPLDMDFLSQPFTVGDNGLTIDVPEGFDPMNNNTPYPQWKVSGLNLVLDPCRTLDGSFDCGGSFAVAVDTESALALSSDVLRKMTVAMGSN